jgi:hypothetical protein
MAKPPSSSASKAKASAAAPAGRSRGRKSNAAAAPWISQIEAERLMGYSVTTLKSWRNKGCPGVSVQTGKCNLGLIAEWLADQREADVTKKFISVDQSVMTMAEIERQNELQDLYGKQIKNAEKLRLLIPREMVRTEVSRQFGKLHSEAQQMETTWAERFAMEGVVDGKGNVNACAKILAELRQELFANLRADLVVDPVRRDKDTGEEIGTAPIVEGEMDEDD